MASLANASCWNENEPRYWHFAPLKPELIQSSDLTPAGGFTHSAGKREMSTKVTIFLLESHLVRAMAVSCIA